MAKKDKKDKKGKGSKGAAGVDVNLGDQVLTPLFRVKYIALPGDDDKYALTAVFPKGTNLDEMSALADITLRAKFGDDIDEEDYKYPFNDGDKYARKQAKKNSNSDNEYMLGTTYCNMSSQYPVEVFDVKGNLIAEEEYGKKIYSGMWARAIVSAYAYEYADKDGVSFGLQKLEKVADDEKIASGGMSTEDARSKFKSVAVDAPKGKGKKDKNKKDKDEDEDDGKKGKGKKGKDKKGKK